MTTTELLEKTNKQAKNYMSQIATETEKRLDSMESTIESMKKTLSNKSEVAMKKASETRDQAEDVIKSSPFKTVAAAAVLGATLGFLATRKKNK